MKQHITTDQLDELSEKGKKRLKKWCLKKTRAGERWTIPNNGGVGIAQYDYNSSYNTKKQNRIQYIDEGEVRSDRTQLTDEEHNGEYPLPLLSIGRMVEFLGENWEWRQREAGMCPDNKALHPKYLCDGLWKATKEILEK
jgi:hypothetical protein